MNRADALRRDRASLHFEMPISFANIHVAQPSVTSRYFSHLAADSPGTDVALSVGKQRI
jgi:hypothetical protein